MRIRHLELPNGTDVKLSALGKEEMEFLVENKRLQAVATNFPYKGKSYALFYSTRLGHVYGVENE
ncbi:hypothetical protein D3C81_908770 [compost metagenome]